LRGLLAASFRLNKENSSIVNAYYRHHHRAGHWWHITRSPPEVD